jgi:hypothetical protein
VTLVSHSWPATDSQRRIVEFFAAALESGQIPKELFPEALSRFAKNVYGLAERTKGSAGQNPPAVHVEGILDACKTELAERGCPRSISLFQFVLGASLEREVFPPKFKSPYRVLVTDALETFCPKVAQIPPENRIHLSD